MRDIYIVYSYKAVWVRIACKLSFTTLLVAMKSILSVVAKREVLVLLTADPSTQQWWLKVWTHWRYNCPMLGPSRKKIRRYLRLNPSFGRSIDNDVKQYALSHQKTLWVLLTVRNQSFSGTRSGQKNKARVDDDSNKYAAHSRRLHAFCWDSGTNCLCGHGQATSRNGGARYWQSPFHRM